MADAAEWQRRCEALEQELRDLASSLSHDLRAPLRAMDGFSRTLLEDYASTLDPQAREYLAWIRKASTQMASRLDALTRLARVAAAPLAPADVDLGGLCRGLAAEMQAREPQRQVKVVVAEPLRGFGDPALLRALLGCLLENAWKFTRTRIEPCIEVSAEITPDERVVVVRDNGIGFDPRYADRLFHPFARLHPGDEAEGMGIGLAVARRIVQRHGGRIWGTGVPDGGAVFSFALPAQ